MTQDKSLKIAFVIEKYIHDTVGGEPAIFDNLIKHFRQKGVEVDIYCEFNETSETDVFGAFSSHSTEYIKQINDRKYDYIIGNRRALRYDDLHCDLYAIHEHSFNYSQRTKIGRLYKLFTPKKEKIKHEAEVLNNHKEATFIFCSKNLQEDFCQLAELKNTNVIYPYPNIMPPNDYKKVQNEIFTFGMSALGFANKGGYLALKSAFLLKLSGEKFKLRIIYKKKPYGLQLLLVNLFGLNDYVEFVLKQEDMNAFYSHIDCLLVPSMLESFGMVAIEGNSWGLPVILSSNCGAVEVLKGNKNALVFKYDFFKIFNLYREMKKVITNKEDYVSGETVNFLTVEEYNKKFEEILFYKQAGLC